MIDIPCISGAYHYSSYPNDPSDNSEIVDNSMDDEIIDVTEVNGDFFTESCSTAKADELSVVTGVFLHELFDNNLVMMNNLSLKVQTYRLLLKFSLTIVKIIKIFKTIRILPFGDHTD